MKKGCLYLVATPIGNLKDITIRAIEILQSVDQIVAEDSRRSSILLNHFTIKKPIISLHAFNEKARIDHLLGLIFGGQSLALISDAGTPLISDPGYHLIKESRAKGVNIIPVPGPCAAIAALSASGLATDRFTFIGFLPAKSSTRKSDLKILMDRPETLIFYEAPHRLQALLQDMKVVMGERQVVIARELTKIHEEFLSDNLSNLITYFEQNSPRGELVVLVEGRTKPKTDDDHTARVLKILLGQIPFKKAIELTVELTGARKNEVYDMALQMDKNDKV